MPAVLKHTFCPSCGHRHHFSLLTDELTPGHDYSFVCPVTAARTFLRPLAPPEPARYPPQGAVQLSPVEEGVAVGQA
jgi:hypothetical protein